MTLEKSKSAVLAIMGVLSLSVSMSIAKQLDTNIPTVMVVFVRSGFGLLFFIPILIKERSSLSRINNIPLHIIRVALAVLAMLCTYYTYRNLPIAFATSIGMTSPIFTTALSGLILKEVIGYKKWGLVILGYIGALIVIKPTSFILDTAIITALLANLLAATCIIIIKILSKKNSIVTIMLVGNVGIFTVSFLMSLVQWHPLSAYDIGLLSLTGALGIITQLCLNIVIKRTSPSFVAPFEYSRMFFATVIGFVVFNEIPAISTIIGVSIIIASTYTMLLLKKKQKD
jgi:drug/metabolite transporter (DMT)-like permease